MSSSPTGRLQEVADSFTAEIREIEAAFVLSDLTARVTGYVMPYVPHDDGCVVSLWDAWNRFLRRLSLTSCAGPVLGISGATYSPASSLSEVNALSVVRLKQNRIQTVRGEPKWYNVTALSNILTVLGVQNNSVIIGAIGATNISLGTLSVVNPLAEIQSIRNFIAHKHASTLNDVRGYMGRGIVDVHAHLRERTVGGLPRFSEWIDVLVVLADAACS